MYACVCAVVYGVVSCCCDWIFLRGRVSQLAQKIGKDPPRRQRAERYLSSLCGDLFLDVTLKAGHKPRAGGSNDLATTASTTSLLQDVLCLLCLARKMNSTHNFSINLINQNSAVINAVPNQCDPYRVV